MHVIHVCRKCIGVFICTTSHANLTSDDALIMGNGGPLDSLEISADRKGALWYRDQHGTATAGAARI